VSGSPLNWSVRLSLFYAAFFTTAGVAMPWFPVYLASLGLDPGEIGVLLAVGFWIKPIVNPLATRWADARGERRRLITLFLVGTAGAFALYSVGGSFPVYLLIALLAVGMSSPVLPLFDNVALTAASERDLDYGRMRLWGSVTFIVAVYAAGWMLEGRETSIILWLIVGGHLVTALVGWFIPDVSFPKTDANRRSPYALLRHPVFAIFLIATGLNSAAHAVLYGFGSIHWQAIALSDSEIGILWAIGVVAEIILFWQSKPIIARIGPLKLMLLGCASGILRWTLTAEATGFVELSLLQVLHAFTFGAAHLGAMHFIQRAAPDGLSASAQGLFAAFGMGLFMGIGAIGAGQLYEAFAGQAYYVMSVLSVLSTLMAFWLMRRWDGERLTMPG